MEQEALPPLNKIMDVQGIATPWLYITKGVKPGSGISLVEVFEVIYMIAITFNTTNTVFYLLEIRIWVKNVPSLYQFPMQNMYIFRVRQVLFYTK